MLRERCHRFPPRPPDPRPRGDPRPGPPSLSAEPGNAPRPPPSIPAGQPPIPASPGQARTCGGPAGLRLCPQRRAPRGQERQRGERDEPVTWCWAGGGLSAFVPQTSRWRRGAWPALLAPARPALRPASPLAGRAPPRAHWALPPPLLPGERGREGSASPRIPAPPRPSARAARAWPRGRATPPLSQRALPPPERAAKLGGTIQARTGWGPDSRTPTVPL